MKWASKAVNDLLRPFDIRVSRASSFDRLISEVVRQQEQQHQEQNEQRENARLLQLSQARWRADEPDDGLTWGVRMSGNEFVRVLLSHCKLDNATIVEIGPGYGRLLDTLLKHSIPFRRYIGLEISASRVARLREHFRNPRIEFIQADVLEDVHLDAVADVTFSSAVFEHLYPDFGRALQTISRFTRLDGAVVIDFIRDDNDVDKAASWFDGETYMRTYSAQELKTLFEAHEFTIIHSERISFGLDILHRDIARTIVVARAGLNTFLADSLDTSAPAKVKPFEFFVYQSPPPCDPLTVAPPVLPQFRSNFGGLWTDLESADAIVAGKVEVGDLSAAEAQLVASWRRDGFVVLRGAVDDASIDAALNDFEEAFNGTLGCKMSYWDDAGHHIESAGYSLARKKDAKLLDLYSISPNTQAIQFARPIRRFLDILFQRPALAFQSLGFYYGSQQPLHQDTAFVRVNSPMEFVASWIALENIEEGSGELEYYVGSHAVPQHLFRGKNLWAQAGDPEDEAFSARLHATATEAGLRMQRFLPRKGDVLIWSAGLMHGGSPVTSPTSTRKSLVTHYCPADLQPMYAYKGGRPKRKSVAGNYIMAELWGVIAGF